MVGTVHSIGAGSIPNDLQDVAAELMNYPVSRAVLVTECNGEVLVRALGRDMDSIEMAGMLSIALTAVAWPADA